MDGPRVRGGGSGAARVVRVGGESGLTGLLWDQVEVEAEGSARTRAQGDYDLIPRGPQSEEDLRELTRLVIVLVAL